MFTGECNSRKDFIIELEKLNKNKTWQEDKEDITVAKIKSFINHNNVYLNPTHDLTQNARLTSCLYLLSDRLKKEFKNESKELTRQLDASLTSNLPHEIWENVFQMIPESKTTSNWQEKLTDLLQKFVSKPNLKTGDVYSTWAALRLVSKPFAKHAGKPMAERLNRDRMPMGYAGFKETKHLMNFLKDAGKYLEHLDFSDAPHIDLSPENAGLISLYCPNLRSLNVKGHAEFDFLSLTQFAIRCPLLEHLDITDCQPIAENSVTSLSTHSQQLKSLTLNGAAVPIDTIREKLPQVELKCDKATGFDSSALASLAEHIPSMNGLKLDNRTVHHIDIQAINQDFDHLNELSLRNTSITIADIVALVQLCPNLRVLDLSHLPIDENDIYTILRHCPSLERLIAETTEAERFNKNTIKALCPNIQDISVLYKVTRTLNDYE